MQTYEEILERMCEKYEEKTGNHPDKASDIGVRMEVLAGEIFSAQVQMEWLKNQMFPQTATGEYLDLHAKERGLTRKSGTKAVGEVTFYLPELLGYDIEVPKDTVCATTGENPVRFITTEAVTIKSGRLAADAPVEALNAGSGGNVSATEISVLVTPVAEIEYIKNDYKLENGSDDESDEQLRERVLDSYVHIPNGTNKAFYIKTAMEVAGVTAVGVIPQNRGMGTVDVFIMTEDGNPSQEILDEVKARLDEQREINVDISVSTLTKSGVSIYGVVGLKDGYDVNIVSANCIAAVKEYFSLLGAGENVYLSDIGEYLERVEGVENYTFQANLCKDIEISPNAIAVPNTILITGRDY